MASAQFIRDQLNGLEAAILELQTFADLSMGLAGESEGAPQWPWLVDRMVRRVDECSQALQRSFRQLHLAADGGMGAMAPMETLGGGPDQPSTQADANGLGDEAAQARPDSSTRK